MRSLRRSPTITWSTTLSLVVALVAGILVADNTHAQPKPGSNKSALGSNQADKVSPDQRGRVRSARDAKKNENRNDENLVKVILQFNGPPSEPLNALLRRNGVHVKRHFQNFNSKAVELPASVVDELAAFDEVRCVSLDAEVKSFGHVSLTTGADAARSSSGSGTGLDGTGIGIAVLDSGVASDHVSFLNKTDDT